MEGPYWTFPRAKPTEVGFIFVRAVRFVLMGSSRGTAMPSAHCAVSCICWIGSMVYHVPLAILSTLLVPGLCLATVWCGFHYALDSISGTLWGVACAVAGILLAKHTAYFRPQHDKAYGHGLGNMPQKLI